MSFRARCFFLLITLVCTAITHAEKPALLTRIFKLPPDFISCESAPSPESTADKDPFATREPATSPALDSPAHPKLKTPRQILESIGVTFPEGASASFNPFTSLLTVTNSVPNIEITEAFVASITQQAPANVGFTLTIIEAPGDLIRQSNALASRSLDAAPALALLLDHAQKPGSKVRVVGDAFLETKSGTRATLDAGLEHRYVSNVSLDAKSRSAISAETRHLGLHWEIEPSVSTDGAFIETSLALDFYPAPPTTRQLSISDPLTGHATEFPLTDLPGTQINTSVSFLGGGTRLLGITRPVGTPRENSDLLCAVFLTATVRRVEALPAPQPKVTSPSTIPKGMQFAAMHAPDGVFDEALRPKFENEIGEPPRLSKPPTLQTHFAKAGATFPPGSFLEHREGVLRCVNTPDNIALISTMLEHDLAVFPKTVAFTFHTLEAPAPLLRDLTRETLASTDDSAMLAAVEAAVARGEARFIQSAFIETKSGNKAAHHSAHEHCYLESEGSDGQGYPSIIFDTRRVGSVIEVEPTVGADSRTVELTCFHELHPTPPVTRQAQLRDPASQQPFDQPLTDFNVHKIVTGINLTKGGTKLLALNPPAGHPDTGVLWATFVKCEVIPQVARSPYSFVPPPPASDAKEIHTRSYRVPPDFLSAGGDATTPDDKKKPKTAKEILEAVGITFPPGTAAYYGPPSTRLVVTNTNENLDLVEAYVGWGCGSIRHTTACTAHVLQGPGPLLRRLAAQASSKSNHRAELDELLTAVKAGTVQHLNMARVETRSGTRASSTQNNEHIFIADVSLDDKQRISFNQEMRQVGLRLELEPSVGSDGATVELTLSNEFHTAPPLEHREHLTDTQGHRLEFPLTDFFTTRTTTAITLPSTSARLLSLYKPTGKPEFEKQDILQAIFITCDILRPGE
ncbi:hypothetical protein [Prosthecobacter fluviatilis]|uniref:Uncharacterized protein n=1 Tax=Prosthecobacter fluviatilis TaxID=445931 RepID=A0ABW0KND1_9BACT